MDTYGVVCICGKTPEQHAGADHPFIPTGSFVPATLERLAKFRGTRPEFPGAVYIQKEDRLLFTVLNASGGGGEVDISARILLETGDIIPFRSQFLFLSSSAPQTLAIDLTEGFLLSIAIETPTINIVRGSLLCIVTLIRGVGGIAFTDAVLIQDYVTTTTKVGWPSGVIAQGKSGFGATNNITVAAPAAGAELSFGATLHTASMLHSIFFTLTTAVAAANREVTLVLDDGTTPITQIPSGFTQLASLSHSYCFALGVTQFAGAQVLLHVAPVPPVQLFPGWRIRTLTTNLQAADQYSAAKMFLEQWPEA